MVEWLIDLNEKRTKVPTISDATECDDRLAFWNGGGVQNRLPAIPGVIFYQAPDRIGRHFRQVGIAVPAKKIGQGEPCPIFISSKNTNDVMFVLSEIAVPHRPCQELRPATLPWRHRQGHQPRLL
jgi:hypothetical protein